MSSFHQKGQSQDSMNKIECPNCGKIAMLRKMSDTILADGKLIRHISRWVCQNCNEEVFDRDAMKEIRRQRALKSKAA
jgi:YgiT-type zinc finger domain-containing protein